MPAPIKKEDKYSVKEETDDDDAKSVKVEPKHEDADAEQQAVQADVYMNQVGVFADKAALGPRAMVGAPPKADGAGDDVLEIEEILRQAHKAHLADPSAKRRPAAVPDKKPAAHPVAAVVRRLKRRRIVGKKRGEAVDYGLTTIEMEAKAKIHKNIHTYKTWAYQKVRKQLKRVGYDDSTAKKEARWWHNEVKATWAKFRGS